MSGDKKLSDIPEQWAMPPAALIEKLPKGGVMLDFLGHANCTLALIDIDPDWSWEPMALDENGLPALDEDGNLWIRLTVLGKTLPAVGDGPSMKVKIGDALRNGAMRFGVATKLWVKDHETPEHEAEARPAKKAAAPRPAKKAAAKKAAAEPPPANADGEIVCAKCGQPIGTAPLKKVGGKFLHRQCPEQEAVEAVQDAFPGAEIVDGNGNPVDPMEEPF